MQPMIVSSTYKVTELPYTFGFATLSAFHILTTVFYYTYEFATSGFSLRF